MQIDSVGGAYPSMVELPNGLVYCVYCEEGKGSSIRGVRLKVSGEGVEVCRRVARLVLSILVHGDAK